MDLTTISPKTLNLALFSVRIDCAFQNIMMEYLDGMKTITETGHRTKYQVHCN